MNMLRQNKLVRLIYKANKYLLKMNFYVLKQNNRTIYDQQKISFKLSILKFFEKTLRENINNNKYLAQEKLNRIENNSTNKLYNIKTNLSTHFNSNKLILNTSEKIEEQSYGDFIKNLIGSLESTDVVKKRLYDLDKQCCKVLDIMSYHDTFKLLVLFCKSIPTKIINMNFYKQAIEKMKGAILNNSLTEKEMIMLLFFLALKKKNAAEEIRLILQYLPPLNNLLLIEKCIIAESTFKCDVTLTREQIKDLEETVENNGKFLVVHRHLLISLCKALRHGIISKNFNLNNLSTELISNTDKYDIISGTHILQLYAEMYFLELNVLKRLVNDVVKDIIFQNKILANEGFNSRKHKEHQIKYIDGFLWSISRLNYKLIDNDYHEICLFIHHLRPHLIKEPSVLVNVLLSLWILDYQQENIVQECITKQIFLHLKNDKFWKTQARLDLLLNCIKIESSNIIIPNDLRLCIRVGLTISRAVKIIYNIVNVLSQEMQFENVVIECPVKGIYIPGVSFVAAPIGHVHIDVLDESTCLRFLKTPHGLMNLKLRLIKKLGYYSILIDGDDIKDAISSFVFIEKRLHELVSR